MGSTELSLNELVIAGAGTGKTTFIVERVAQLISSKKAKPEEILALTFTDKAADEMEIRIDQKVPYGYIDIMVSTFHAFGDRVLREHAIDLKLRPDYKVLSFAEQLIFLREHIFELPLKYYKSLSDPTRNLEAILKAISRAQDEDISPKEYEGLSRKMKDDEGRNIEIAKIYKKYQKLKAEHGFVDFGDQVGLVLKLFRKRPKILKKYQGKFKYIFVDEFQDTNFAQFQLLKLLAAKKTKLTVVGDDDQSIYKFRGASVSNILGFQKVYKGCKKIVLTKNYRSSQIILDAARRLIKHNDPDRLEVIAKVDKRLKAVARIKDNAPLHKHFDRVSAEADWVAKTIKEKFGTGYKYADFAILVRSNSDAEPFRQALNMAGVPFQFSGGGGLYFNPEVQLAVSFLKSIGDLTDSAALFHLAASPIYRLNSLDLQKMNSFAKRRNFTLHHVFAHLGEFEVLEDVSRESQATVKKIMDDLKYYIDFAKERTAGEVLYKFLKRSGYLQKLTKEETLENENRLKNLSSFFDEVKAFQEVAEDPKVSEFVKHLNLLREAGDNPESAFIDNDLDAVNILTVHKAKGLEFRVVFMVSLVAEKFPVRSRKDPIEVLFGPKKEDHLQEERRLFYVGMTRAKEELYFTSAAYYGGKRERKVSQFVLEALDLPKADISMIRQPLKDQIELFAPAELSFPSRRKLRKDEPLYLSFYQIDDYLTCPLKYKYAHVLRVPLLPNHQILYGSALHKMAQAYNQARLNEQKISEKELVDVLMINWSPEGFISRTHEEQRLKKAKKAIKLFFKKQNASKRKIKFAEDNFTISRENTILRGRWDRVDEGGYIIDYKSSEVKTQKDADKRAKDNLQLSIYALVWQEKFGGLPAAVELYFFEAGLTGSSKRDSKDIGKTWEKIQKVAGGIRADKYNAMPNSRKCGFCPYSEICPASVV